MCCKCWLCPGLLNFEDVVYSWLQRVPCHVLPVLSLPLASSSPRTCCIRGCSLCRPTCCKCCVSTWPRTLRTCCTHSAASQAALTRFVARSRQAACTGSPLVLPTAQQRCRATSPRPHWCVWSQPCAATARHSQRRTTPPSVQSPDLYALVASAYVTLSSPEGCTCSAVYNSIHRPMKFHSIALRQSAIAFQYVRVM